MVMMALLGDGAVSVPHRLHPALVRQAELLSALAAALGRRRPTILGRRRPRFSGGRAGPALMQHVFSYWPTRRCSYWPTRWCTSGLFRATVALLLRRKVPRTSPCPMRWRQQMRSFRMPRLLRQLIWSPRFPRWLLGRCLSLWLSLAWMRTRCAL